MSKSIEQRRAEVLLDTIQFYGSDPAHRRAYGMAGCDYYIDGKMCAVGRLCGENVAKKLKNVDVYRFFGDYKQLMLANGSAVLPTEVEELGERFLKNLQMLHDGRYCWIMDSKGLTLYGKTKARFIDDYFCNGYLQKSLVRKTKEKK